MDDDIVLKEFAIEASELLDEAEESLLSLDRGEEFDESYNSIFRAFHSVKGSSGMLGFDKLQDHTHHLESLMVKYNDKDVFTIELIDYLLSGVDVSKKLLISDMNFVFEYVDPILEVKDNSKNDVEVVEKEPEACNSMEAEVENDDILLNSSEGLLVEEGSSEEKDKKTLEIGVLISNNAYSDYIVEILHIENVKFTEINNVDDPLIKSVELLLIDSCAREKCMDLECSKLLLVEEEHLYEAKDDHVIALMPVNQTDEYLKKIINIYIETTKQKELFEKLLKLSLFQFSDLAEYLLNNGKEKILSEIKCEFTQIIKENKELSLTSYKKAI